MTCQEFEELLASHLEPSAKQPLEIDAHCLTCENCHEFARALRDLDQCLTVEFAGIDVTPGFDRNLLVSVRGEAQIARPTPLPDILETVAWASTAALIAGSVYLLAPPQLFTAVFLQLTAIDYGTPMLLLAAAIAIAVATWSSVRCNSELSR